MPGHGEKMFQQGEWNDVTLLIIVKNLFTIHIEGLTWSNTFYQLQPFSLKLEQTFLSKGHFKR